MRTKRAPEGGAAEGVSQRLFAGHFIIYESGGRPAYLFGPDWKEALLPKRTAREYVLDGLDSGNEWGEGIKQQVDTSGSAILHFDVTRAKSGSGIAIADCSPSCPAAKETRPFLAPTKGEA